MDPGVSQDYASLGCIFKSELGLATLQMQAVH